MKFKRIIINLALVSSASLVNSCVDLDIAPPNMVINAYETANHVEADLARFYTLMPIEDFRYSIYKGFNDWYIGGINEMGNSSGEGIGRDVSNTAAELHSTQDGRNNYWDDAYILVRETTKFINEISATAHFKKEQVDNWIGEAYFARAFAYFALAKRYGGVPIVDQVIYSPETPIEDLQLFRNSEEETWDFVADDFDRAIEKLSPNAITATRRGHINKYGAYAMKARAMLFAGSVGRFNMAGQNYDDPKTGKQINGVSTAKAASYFKQAFEAAKAVEESGQYELYKSDWSATSAEAQVKNFVNIFFNKDSKETILVKDYAKNVIQHGWDIYTIPRQYAGTSLTSGVSPTLDFVELFDGLPKNADGTFKTTDANGDYIMYGTTGDFANNNSYRFEPFKNAEPRLRATVLVPGEIFKGEAFDTRAGIYKKGNPVPIASPLLANNGDNSVRYSTSLFETRQNESANLGSDKQVTLANGQKMTAVGRSGVYYDFWEVPYSGFGIRKYINESMLKEDIQESNSFQSWIELRYAEVLLTKAEAAIELTAMGETVPDVNLQNEANTVIAAIRERAGADPLVGNADQAIVRKERRKELAFEHKTYWDLRRWRVSHIEQNSKQYRALMSFMIDDDYRYFFDSRIEPRNRKYTFDTKWYYFSIPGAERNKNLNLTDNPGY